MSKVTLPARIIFDSQGLMVINKVYPTKVTSFLYDLMYINTNSLQNRKKQIVTSLASYNLIFTTLNTSLINEIKDWLPAALRPISEPKDLVDRVEAITTETDRIWEYAVYLATQPPIQTTIFTSSENYAVYQANKLKEKKDTISIKSDPKDMCDVIDLYVELCKASKQG